MYVTSHSEQLPPAKPLKRDSTSVKCSDFVPKAAFTPDVAGDPHFLFLSRGTDWNCKKNTSAGKKRVNLQCQIQIRPLSYVEIKIRYDLDISRLSKEIGYSVTL